MIKSVRFLFTDLLLLPPAITVRTKFPASTVITHNLNGIGVPTAGVLRPGRVLSFAKTFRIFKDHLSYFFTCFIDPNNKGIFFKHQN